MKKLLIGGAALALAVPALAQDSYPSRPITLIVPFVAGGSTDLIARLIANHAGAELGQTIVMITHNPQAAEMGNRTVEMLDGQIVSHGTAPELVRESREARTRAR